MTTNARFRRVLPLPQFCHRFSPAVLALLLPLAVQAQFSLTNVWSISTDAGRAYVTSGQTERGIACNPATRHVLLVSRATSLRLAIAILDGETGAEAGFLNTNGISGGTYPLNMIGVADDGAIYAGNLSGGATAYPTYKLYRWADETAAPVAVYVGDPGGGALRRWGDNLDVRGAGTNTQVLIGSDGTLAAILTPIDDSLTNFTATTLSISGIAATGDLQKGISFGLGNTFLARNHGVNNLRQISFDLASASAMLVTTHSITSAVTAISMDASNLLLAGIASYSSSTANHRLILYDLSVSGTLPALATLPFPTPGSTNANMVGGIDIFDGTVYAVDTQNGVLAARIVPSSTPVPPAIISQPQSQTAVQGGYVTLKAVATGSRPMSCQWLFNDTLALPSATNSTLVLSNLLLSHAGTYKARFSNSASSATSSTATLTIAPAPLSPVLAPLWQVPADTRYYLNSADNNHRGMAYNPASGNVLVLSRTGSNAVHVIDGTTGEHLRTLNCDPSFFTGGYVALNLIVAADDGRVFAGNLTLNGTTTPFKLYVWPNDSAEAVPGVAWSGDPGAGATNRWGDSMAIRGFGDEVQILISSRNGTAAVILQPVFGPNSQAVLINVTDAPAGSLGLGVAFGAGDTFWGKSINNHLRLVEYNVDMASGRTVYACTNYPNLGPIAVDLEHNLLAGVSRETPDNVRLFDIANLAAGVLNVDTEFFPTDNANDNGTGALAFGPNRLYALDSNNGLIAMTLEPVCVPSPLTIARSGNQVVLSWGRADFHLQGTIALAGRATVWTDLYGPSPITVDAGTGLQFFRLSCP